MNRSQWWTGVRRPLSILVTLCAAAGGLISPPTVTAAQAAPGDQPAWWSYERPAAYEPVSASIKVPMRDGTLLGCDLYRPGHDGEVARGRFPVVISEFTPYTATHQSDTAVLASVPGSWPVTYVPEYAEYFASRGYAVAVCDVRGTGDSGGDFTSWFREIEARDNYDLVEWLAGRPWSTGRVGQVGASYGSLTSQRVAALRPPHLEAIVPQVAPGNIYEWVYPGGIASTQGTTWATMAGAMSYGRVSPVQITQKFADHPLYDEYWRQIDITDDLDMIRVPTLLMGGWQDLFANGTVESFAGRSSRTWLVMGPGQHVPAHVEPHAPVPLGAQLAWWDHWLMQLPDAPLPTARVTSFEAPLAGAGGWQEFAAWPPADVRTERRYLRTDRNLSARPGQEGYTSYEVNALDGPARSWLGDFAAHYPEDPAANQAIADLTRLTFTTAPLTEDTVLAGAPRVHLRAALSAPEGQLVVKVEDVAPDGRVVAMTDGYLKASHRDGHDHEVTITPGEFNDYVVDIRPTHWRFAQGHRIRIAITSGDLPLLPPNAPLGTVTIASGPEGSWVDLPLR